MNALEYNSLRHAIARCHDATSKRYGDYGARGIRVCDRWRFGEGGVSGYQCFLKDMGRRPSAAHSLDRIDNDGIYEPSNCRWATRQQQASNRRHMGVSKYLGVVKPQSRRTPRWGARITHKKKVTWLGSFRSEADAARAYDRAARELLGPEAVLNFPINRLRKA